jgi:hypothetical protein
MAELTNDMIQRRFQKVVSNPTPVNIYGLPNLAFVPLNSKTRGISARAYSAKLMELYREGGFYSEALLPKVLKEICEKHGLDVKLLDKKMALQRKLFEALPEDLQGPYDQLTPEEVAELPPEEQKKREEAIRERGRRIAEFVNQVYTKEELEELEQIRMIEALEQELYHSTAEYHARRYQMVTEILHCARKADNPDEPYFSSEDELEALPVRVLSDLFLAWKQYREGMPSDFFSR